MPEPVVQSETPVDLAPTTVGAIGVGVSAISDPHLAGYLHLRLPTRGQRVHRTVEVVEGVILVDLDERGRLLGIESIGGLVDMDAMGAVLRWMRAPGSEADHD